MKASFSVFTKNKSSTFPRLTSLEAVVHLWRENLIPILAHNGRYNASCSRVNETRHVNSKYFIRGEAKMWIRC